MFPLFDVDEGIWNVFSILQITQKWKINLLHIIFLKHFAFALFVRHVVVLDPFLDQLLGQLFTLRLLRVLQACHDDLLEWSPGIAKNIQLVSKHNL